MMNVVKSLRLLSLITLLIVSTGCAASMAASQPKYKNLDELQPGSRRAHVRAKMGAPIDTEIRGETSIETYQFKQGYKPGTKVARVVSHIILDIATLFLWELIGMPIEISFDGEITTVDVDYDKQNRLIKMTQSIE